MKEYALYKGDEFLGIGTLKQLSEKFNIKEKTLKFYQYPTYQKRMEAKGLKDYRVLVPLDDD